MPSFCYIPLVKEVGGLCVASKHQNEPKILRGAVLIFAFFTLTVTLISHSSEEDIYPDTYRWLYSQEYVSAHKSLTHLSCSNAHSPFVHSCSYMLFVCLECNSLHLPSHQQTLCLDDEVPQLFCDGLFQFAAN